MYLIEYIMCVIFIGFDGQFDHLKSQKIKNTQKEKAKYPVYMYVYRYHQHVPKNYLQVVHHVYYIYTLVYM